MKKQPKAMIEGVRRKLDRESCECIEKLEALDSLLAESQDQPSKFVQRWVEPLTSSGLSFDSALALVIAGHVLPN